MNRTYATFGAAAVALHCVVSAYAAGEGWTSDFTAAKAEAAESGKDLLIDFTGSDWCGWCIRLKAEVFDHEPFKEGVKDHFVLVELDFPRDQSILTEEVIAQNAELQQTYSVSGFPTILLTDADGKPYARTGYQQGGPEAYVAHLDELRGKREARDAAFEEAAKHEGVAKAEALVTALQSMGLADEVTAKFYGDVVEQIKEADPEDSTGFVRAAESKAKLAEYHAGLAPFAQARDNEGALAYTDRAIEAGGMEPAETQTVVMTRAMILFQMENFDGALEGATAAIALDPSSPMVPQMEAIKTHIEQTKAEHEGAAEEEAEEADEE